MKILLHTSIARAGKDGRNGRGKAKKQPMDEDVTLKSWNTS